MIRNKKYEDEKRMGATKDTSIHMKHPFYPAGCTYP